MIQVHEFYHYSGATGRQEKVLNRKDTVRPAFRRATRKSQMCLKEREETAEAGSRLGAVTVPREL